MTIPQPVDLARIHIWVTGRVQGVGFRAFVTAIWPFIWSPGWVHNVGYDQVETVAEGPREVLERFTQVVKTGPRASRVDEAHIEWETSDRRILRVRSKVESMLAGDLKSELPPSFTFSQSSLQDYFECPRRFPTALHPAHGLAGS